MAKTDYYQVLGVDEKASFDTIKRAYRRLAKEFHPDAHPGDKTAEKRFKEISEAYSVLSDSKKRAQYDQMRRFGFPGSRPGAGFHAQDFGVDLSDLFGGFARGGHRRSSRQGSFNLDDFFSFGGLGDLFSQIFDPENGFAQKNYRSSKGQDIHADLEIPFETAVFGGKTVFSIKKDEACSGCKGTGAEGGRQPEICSDCGGSGMISRAQGGFAVSRPCPRCLGKGHVIKNLCQVCSGTGRVKAEKKYSITIAPGTEDGKKVRLAGQGNAGENGTTAGNLIITIRVARHRFFRNKGLDIYCEVPIDREQAKRGTKVKVRTVYGKSVKLNIPPNSNGNRTFRLKGMGIRNKGERGDQYVRIKVT